MIKKSVFEKDLIAGMQNELVKNATNVDASGVDKAVDYLNSAIGIFEDAGMHAQADQVLTILGKIAIAGPQEYPSMSSMMEHGVKPSDLKDLSRDAFSKARVNTALRKMGYTDREIAQFLGHHNLMGEKEAADLLSPDRSFSKVLDWIKNPKEVSPSGSLHEGDEFGISSVASDENNAHKKQVTDHHTKGLTPEKMINNLKHHGTVFNMSDDGQADDLDSDLLKLDNSNADDLLNIDIGGEGLEVSENPHTEDFEDERD